MSVLRQRFGLTLMVNHACNLRCTYCYTGAKFSSPMARETGVAAIDRAFNSLAPGGDLDLSFGGEPLLESGRILDWMTHARTRARDSGKRARFNLTTNGTITHREAWEVMMTENLGCTVSFDGSPHIHDRHRRDARGRGSASLVVGTMQRLLEAGKHFGVIVVVRPDNLGEIPEGLITSTTSEFAR